MNQIFTCKICGAPLDVLDSRRICQCEYCGTKQTVPLLDSDKKKSLFSRANELRIENEFDRAANVYETIISEYPTEPEAYWGLILCKYGIEYIDDPKTGGKVPTCHRTISKSIFDEKDFQNVLTYADSETEPIYINEAKQIDKLQNSILKIANNEKPYDVFICYKETDAKGNRTNDSVYAQDIYDKLTEKGFKTFFSRITLEDKLGQEYEPYIYSALKTSKVMIVVGTEPNNLNSVWVKNEWSRFINFMKTDNTKTLIPCYLGMDPYDFPIEFRNFQGVDLSKIGSIQDLVRGVGKLIHVKESLDDNQIEDIIKKTTNEQKKSNKKLILILTIFIVIVAVAALYFAITRKGETIVVDNSKQVTPASEVDLSTINISQYFDDFPIQVTYGSGNYPAVITIKDISYEFEGTIVENGVTYANYKYTLEYDIEEVHEDSIGNVVGYSNSIKFDLYEDGVLTGSRPVTIPNTEGPGKVTFNNYIALKESERKITWTLNTAGNKTRYQQYYIDDYIIKPEGLIKDKFRISVTNNSNENLYFLYFNIYVYDKNGNCVSLSGGDPGSIDAVKNPIEPGKTETYSFNLSGLKDDDGNFVFEKYDYDETTIIFDFLSYSIDGQNLIDFNQSTEVQVY